MAETRLNLLTLACTLDDEAAVDELLAMPAEECTRLLDDVVPKVEITPGSNAALTTTGRTRSEPFGKLFCILITDIITRARSHGGIQRCGIVTCGIGGCRDRWQQRHRRQR